MDSAADAVDACVCAFVDGVRGAECGDGDEAGGGGGDVDVESFGKGIAVSFGKRVGGFVGAPLEGELCDCLFELQGDDVGCDFHSWVVEGEAFDQGEAVLACAVAGAA